MSLRIKVPLALSLAALLAVGCTNVDQEAAPESFAVATFDAATGTIPLPNDLALQGAPAQTNATVRATLFSFIDAGGFPALLAPSTPIPAAIPLRIVQRNPATGAYEPAGVPSGIEAASVNASTVAFVRVSGEGAPEVVAPVFAGFTTAPPLIQAPSLLVVPATGYVPGARYVVAVRGGDHGVRTSDGELLAAESPIAAILPNRNLNFAVNQPPRTPPLAPAEIAQLEQLRSLYAAPIDWNRMPPPAGTPGAESEAICRAALGIPSAAPFPEQRCWLPPLPPGTFTEGVTPAFDAIDLVFPRTEAASIQVFEIAPAAG